MDSVQTIMKNCNELLARSVKLDGMLDVSFKSASLLEEQNKLQTLFSQEYSDDELIKQKSTCISAYIYLEYSMIPYDDECKRNYYARCEILDLYKKCREHVRELSADVNKSVKLAEFVTNCYKPVSELNELATLSTTAINEDDLKKIKATYDSYVV